MRCKIVSERQKAGEEEREFSRQRYQKQIERDELEVFGFLKIKFQQQKRKLNAEFDQQKQLLVDSFKNGILLLYKERKMEQDNLLILFETHSKQIIQLETTFQNKQDQITRKHELQVYMIKKEMSKFEERLTYEKEEWQTRYMKKHELEIRQREVIIIFNF